VTENYQFRKLFENVVLVLNITKLWCRKLVSEYSFTSC